MKQPLVIFILLFATHCHAQSNWGRMQHGVGTDETMAITGDAAGNTYAVGYFSNSMASEGASLSATGLTDAFLIKMANDGVAEWAVALGGYQSDRGLDVAVHTDGTVAVCGFFTGAMDLGNGVTLTAQGGSQDAFVAKYGVTGEVQWARSGGSDGFSDRANAVSFDLNGNVLVTGQFAGEAHFGSTVLNSDGPNTDIFVAKYNSIGNLLWVKAGSGPGQNRGLAIATDDAGGVYVTGQFGDDITFDNDYENQIINALYVVKFSAAGAEEWFRYAGGSSQSIGYGIVCDGGKVYITGDSGPSITFFNGSTFPVISSTYSNAVFLCAFSAQGNYLWGKTLGSESPLSSRGLSYRNGELAITGWFECTLGELADMHGSGIFNNYGYKDLFVARYDDSGNYIWAQQMGSRKNVVGNDVHIHNDGRVILAGSAYHIIIVPTLQMSVQGLSNYANYSTSNFCGEPYYSHVLAAIGNTPDNDLDGFVIKALDPDQLPLDMYHRENFTDCDRSTPPLTILVPVTDESLVPFAPDTILICPGKPITYHLGTVSQTYAYERVVTWAGSPGSPNSITTGGDYTVNVSSVDGCYSAVDSAFVVVHPGVEKPLMSDSYGINDNDLFTSTVQICEGDSVLLWGQFPDSLSHQWAIGFWGASQAEADSVWASSSGNYTLTVSNSTGCEAFNKIQVTVIPTPPDSIDPVLNLTWNGAVLQPGDTAFYCPTKPVSGRVLNANTNELLSVLHFNFDWNVTPSPPNPIANNNPRTIPTPGTGWYHISVNVQYKDTLCNDNPEGFELSDSVYVVVIPPPQVYLQVSPPSPVCPSEQLILAYSTSYDNLSIPASVQDLGDSLIFPGPGNYSFSGSSSYGQGCTIQNTININIPTWGIPGVLTLPELGLICPDDSVYVYSNSPADTIEWVGPAGPIGTGPGVYASVPGPYFAIASYPGGCQLVSNTEEIIGYATPYITAWPPEICIDGDGDVVLNVIATHPESIVWMFPLSGTSDSQVITEPGTYGAVVTSCGISSEVYITVGQSSYTVSVNQPNSTPVCEGGSIVLHASPGLVDYEWNTGATTPAITVTQAGEYSVVALDPFGCPIISEAFEVSFEPLPPLPVPVFENPCLSANAVLGYDNPDFDAHWIYGGDTTNVSEYTIPNVMGPTSFQVFLASPYCHGPVLEATLEPKPLPAAPFALSDAPVCTGSSLTLFIDNPEQDLLYHWLTPTGITALGPIVQVAINSALDEGDYHVWAEWDACIGDTTEVYIPIYITQQVQLPGDTAICASIDYVLSPDTAYAAYLWQDSSTDSSLTVTESGLYQLLATDFNGCMSEAYSNVVILQCIITVPNIFTPNGDGINDFWLPLADQPQYFSSKVFNSWGKLVFESQNIEMNWDGTHFQNNQPCEAGVYFYVIEYVTFDSKAQNESGYLTLFR